MLQYQEMPLHAEEQTTRLLETLPRAQQADNEPVKCSIRVARFKDVPHFSALSYTWGDGTRRKDIIIDGITVSITENLESGLPHLRHACRSWGRCPVY
jgi:hypothetical protein